MQFVEKYSYEEIFNQFYKQSFFIISGKEKKNFYSTD